MLKNHFIISVKKQFEQIKSLFINTLAIRKGLNKFYTS